MKIEFKDPNLIAKIGDFMRNYLVSVRNRDDDTILSYKYSVNLYLQFLKEVRKIKETDIQSCDFNQTNIVEFLSWLKTERDNVATTINHRLSDIRGLCQYLCKKNVLTLDSLKEICEIENVADEGAIALTWLSYKEISDTLSDVNNNRESVRDRFLLSLLYESGGRISEVLSLKISDLKPTSQGAVDVHFYGKGRKHRITPLSEHIWKMFSEYSSLYHPQMNMNDYLFYICRNGNKNKMSVDNVSRILAVCEKHLREKNPELIHLHSHLFRRSRAMHLFQAGVPLPTISDWLGHSNIETTRFYAKVTTEMKRDAMKKLGESKESVFNSDVPFKYADDAEAMKRLCGLL